MSTRTIEAHPELWRGLDDPSEADREWFHNHPGVVLRFRPLLPEELDAWIALGQVMGEGPPAIRIAMLGEELPLTHAVVVDVLRLHGQPHGPDGESGRFRFCCPEPTTRELADLLAREALARVLTVMPGKRRRHPRPSRGFGG